MVNTLLSPTIVQLKISVTTGITRHPFSEVETPRPPPVPVDLEVRRPSLFYTDRFISLHIVSCLVYYGVLDVRYVGIPH